VSEDRWTSPAPWCPRPGWWHADDPVGTELEVSELAAAFTRALQPEIVVETGTYLGQTAEAIGIALQRNGHGHLWTLEVDGKCAAFAERRLAVLPATVVCQDSLTWDPPGPVGFAWIDSGPGPGGLDGPADIRFREIARWLPCFAPGAVIGVHDTAPHHQVLVTLMPLLESGQLASLITLRTPRGVTFVQVPG